MKPLGHRIGERVLQAEETTSAKTLELRHSKNLGKVVWLVLRELKPGAGVGPHDRTGREAQEGF